MSWSSPVEGEFEDSIRHAIYASLHVGNGNACRTLFDLMKHEESEIRDFVLVALACAMHSPEPLAMTRLLVELCAKFGEFWLHAYRYLRVAPSRAECSPPRAEAFMYLASEYKYRFPQWSVMVDARVAEVESWLASA